MTGARPVPILTIDALRCWFQTPGGMVRAVEGVSLTVPDGQALGVVGESGSGKSQTFFSVLGLTHGWPGVVGGRANLRGRELLDGLDSHVTWSTGGDGQTPVFGRGHSRWAAERRLALAPALGSDVAMLFQDPRRSLVPYWTVGRHLTEVVRRHGAGADTPASVRALLSEYGFRQPERILAAFPGQLSGGEAQRVMLAMTVALRPKLLVADEPTTALDALNQAAVLETLVRMHEASPMSMVLISHDLAVIRRVVGHVVVFFGGRVVERAPVEVLLGDGEVPRHPYSAALREGQRRRAAALPIHGSPTVSVVSADREAGCPYHVRCELRPRLAAPSQARCRGEAPTERRVGPQHSIACWGVPD